MEPSTFQIEQITVYKDGIQVIFRVSSTSKPSMGTIGVNIGITVAGSTSDPGVWSYQLNNPTAILMDQYGYLYILDYSNSRVQKWWPGATYGTTVVAATMSNPMNMKFDRLGGIVIADTYYHRIISFALTCREYCIRSSSLY